MRIGLLGGSFNPIHNGHIAIAEAAKERLRLDCVLFLPAAEPPHKHRGLLPYELRLQLIREALESHSGLIASDLDRATDTPNYTLFLIDRVREVYPGDELFFIIGEDNVGELPRWYRWQELLDKVSLAVVTRNGQRETRSEIAEKMCYVPMKPVRISSTSVRRRIRRGISLDGIVPPSVAVYFGNHPEAFR